jgi:hypothetical protein
MTQHKADCRQAWSNYDATCPRRQELMQGAARPGACGRPARVVARPAVLAPSASGKAVVFFAGEGWMVDWNRSPEASKIQSLFGTTILPSPFTKFADAAEIFTAISVKNPQ